MGYDHGCCFVAVSDVDGGFVVAVVIVISPLCHSQHSKFDSLISALCSSFKKIPLPRLTRRYWTCHCSRLVSEMISMTGRGLVL